MTVKTSSLDVLPDSYSVGMIDYERLGEPCKGRFLACDRGHEHHHPSLGPGAQCHMHRDNAQPTRCERCEFRSALELVCQQGVHYWSQKGHSALVLEKLLNVDRIELALKD